MEPAHAVRRRAQPAGWDACGLPSKRQWEGVTARPSDRQPQITWQHNTASCLPAHLPAAPPPCSCCVLVFQGDGGHRNEVLTLSWKAEARQAPDDSQCGEAPGGDLGMLLSGKWCSSVKLKCVGEGCRQPEDAAAG